MWAQPSYKLETITINEGLSQSAVLSVLQDKKGFIWISSKDGLNRFDGHSFKIFRHNTKKPNSISNNNVKCIYEDSKGNIWVGTYRGLNKFDPITETFTVYQKSSPDSLGLSNNIVTAVLEDSGGNIWIGTNSGLNQLIINSNKIINSGTSSENIIFQALKGKAIKTLFEDSDQNIWVGTFQNGLFCIDKNRLSTKNYLIDKHVQSGEEINLITSIGEWSKDEIIVGTFGKGVYTFNKSKNLFSRLNLVCENSLVNISQYAAGIKKNKTSDIYLLTNKELVRITGKDRCEKIWEIINLSVPSSFIIDNSGIIWIGSDGAGVAKLIPVQKKFTTVSKLNKPNNGFGASSVRAILADKNGNLLVGGYFGLYEAENSSKRLRTWKEIKQFTGINIFSLAEDPIDKNILWVGTEGSGLFKFNRAAQTIKKFNRKFVDGQPEFLGNEVYDIQPDKYNDIYFATDCGVTKYNRADGSFINFVYDPSNANSINEGKVKALCADDHQKIWMGTERSGLSVWDSKSKSFLHFEYEPDNPFSLSDNKINIIFRDNKNNIWVGTSGGLNRYVPERNNFIVYTIDDGLANDCIYGILEDGKGCLWLSTNKGISKFNPGNKTFLNYDESYGLQSNEFNTGAYFKSDNGELFFGGINGFTSFYSSEVLDNPNAPQTIITGFKKFNQPVDLEKSISYSDEIILSHDDYFFSFEFALPEYTFPQKNTFSYMLEGFNDRWIKTGEMERTASFTGISPGKYTLRVRGANNDGIWGKETLLKIIITPPFWQTWGFRISTGIIIIGLVILFLRRKFNQLKRDRNRQIEFSNKLIEHQESERKRIAGELHDSIGQDLLIAKNKLILKLNSGGVGYVEDVSQILSHSIDDISKISHNLHPCELDELGLSMAVEAMVERVSVVSETNFILRIDNIDGFIKKDDQINLYRIIQEAVNNIVKHSRAKEAIIKSTISKNNLTIEISDNGVGFVKEVSDKLNRPHFGLSGMKERINLMNGDLIVSSKKDIGTIIKLSIPVAAN